MLCFNCQCASIQAIDSVMCVLAKCTSLVAIAALIIGNEGVPIQLAQCRFPGLAISNAKI